MPSFKESLKNWFGYSRRERRSTFILLILILSVAGVRFVLPERELTIVEIPGGPSESYNESHPYNKTIGFIPKKQEVSVKRKQRPLLDLNTCDSTSLEALPGIGPVLSARIVKYRNLLGGYASIGQLKEVYGLTGETFSLISGRVFADSGAVKKIKVNSADFKGLIRLPYFERYEVNAILKFRELNGRIDDIGDMIDNKIITNEKAVRVKPYLEFGD